MLANVGFSLSLSLSLNFFLPSSTLSHSGGPYCPDQLNGRSQPNNRMINKILR